MRAVDAGLAARDEALPALPLFLDDRALGDWLAERGLPAGRRRYLRYKPGTSCVLGLDLTSRSGTATAVLSTWSADGAPKLAKTLRRAPQDAVLAHDERLGLLLTTAAADRDLPAIAALTGPRCREVLGRLLPGADLTGAAVQTLRYKPARRWVAVLTRRGAPPLLLRAHRPEASADVLAALAALGAPRIRLPRLVAADPALGLTVMEWLHGQTLADLPDGDRDRHLRATGRVLAQLHQHPAPGLRRRRPDTVTGQLHAAANTVSVLLPGEAARVQELEARIRARLRAPSGARVCHGDFSADQVVVGPRGPALADLDEVALDDPVTDLATSAAAHRADERPGDGDEVALLAGYAAVRPLPPASQLAAHTAAAVLRRAPEPFRCASPSWEAGVARALDTAEAALR